VLVQIGCCLDFMPLKMILPFIQNCASTLYYSSLKGAAAAGFSAAGLAGSGVPAAGGTPSGLGSSAIRYSCKITTINTGGVESQISASSGAT